MNDPAPGPCGKPPSDAPAALVAFDFDGTLTVRDSFTAFIRWRTPFPRLALGVLRLVPAALRYLIDRDRGALKAAATRVFLGGIERRALMREAEAFAAACADSLFRPDALARWDVHRLAGETVVVVTASPALVVEPFARRLGADRLIGTELAWDAAGRLSGGFATPNCRGVEKVRRLRAVYGPDLRLDAAYGDTAGDREMLALSARPGMKVFTGRPAARAVSRG